MESEISEAELFGISRGIRSDVLQNELTRYEMTLQVAPRVAAMVLPDGRSRLAKGACAAPQANQVNSASISLPSRTESVEAVQTDSNPAGMNCASNSAVGKSGIPAPPDRSVTQAADIWLMDTNWISRTDPTPEQFSRMTCRQWRGGQVWENHTLEEFTSTLTPGQPVLFYIHGNQTETQEAIWHGLQTLRCLPAHPQARLVVFDWPAQRISPLLRIEFGTKAVYADYQGFYLAQVLIQMSANTPILLVGHSFGSRTVLSALHLLSGGSYAGRTLTLEKNEGTTEGTATGKTAGITEGTAKGTTEGNAAWKAESTEGTAENVAAQAAKLQITAVLIAAATNYTDFVPNGVYEQAPKAAQQIRVVQNPLDPALKFYPLMGIQAPMPEAMGKIGPATCGMADEDRAKIRMSTVTLQSHAYLQYLALPEVTGLLH